MPRYLIPKSDGRWAVYSTVSDDLIMDDAMDQEYVDRCAAEASAPAVRAALAELADLRSGRREPEMDYDTAKSLAEQAR
jgi:hypothetical protein